MCTCKMVETYVRDAQNNKIFTGMGKMGPSCDYCLAQIEAKNKARQDAIAAHVPVDCEHCGHEMDFWETENESCKECCDHEYDPDEGMICINCNSEYPY